MSDETKQLYGVLTFLLAGLFMALYFGKQCNETNAAKTLQCIQAGKDPFLCEKVFDIKSN